MAKLPKEMVETIWDLKQQTLSIVEESSATEFVLFDVFSETDQTISYMNEMKNVAEAATSSYSRLCQLHLQVAQAQPNASRDLLQFLHQVIVLTQTRLPAWKRSIEEVKIEWNLP